LKAPAVTDDLISVATGEVAAISVIIGTPREGYEQAYRAGYEGIVSRICRGQKMRTRPRLFDEFAAALQFPSYFGENWDALDECLNDLDWLGGGAYLLMITEADQVLIDEDPHQARILGGLLQNAHTEWGTAVTDGRGFDRPAISFRTVLQVSDNTVANDC
jgi:hypothetical protein